MPLKVVTRCPIMVKQTRGGGSADEALRKRRPVEAENHKDDGAASKGEVNSAKLTPSLFVTKRDNFLSAASASLLCFLGVWCLATLDTLYKGLFWAPPLAAVAVILCNAPSIPDASRILGVIAGCMLTGDSILHRSALEHQLQASLCIQRCLWIPLVVRSHVGCLCC